MRTNGIGMAERRPAGSLLPLLGIALLTSPLLACMGEGMEQGELGAADASSASKAASANSAVEETKEDLVLVKSVPSVPGGPTSYAKVTDRLRITSDRVEFVDNGDFGGCNCFAKAWITVPGQPQRYLGGSARWIRDGGSVWYNDSNQTTVTVEHLERSATCFNLTFWGGSFGSEGGDNTYSVNYCWDQAAGNWKNQNSGTFIGSDQSATVRVNSHQVQTYHWRIDWEATLVSGVLDPSPSGTRDDGPEWHHLVSIPWATNSTITASLAPITGDPDLYAGTNFRPSTSHYSFASTNGPGSDDSCAIGSLGSAYFSVKNYRTDMASSYDLVVDQAPGGWTAWLNRDGPSGGGDGEHLSEFVAAGTVCSKPLAAQCRRVSDKKPWMLTGEVYACSAEAGGNCINANQPDGTCDDYEVRFYCP